MRDLFILMIESFEGDRAYVRCGDGVQDHLFCVVKVYPEGHAQIVDSGYRTYSEAVEAWPEAGTGRINPAGMPPRKE